jgi:lambda family phage portal protein
VPWWATTIVNLKDLDEYEDAALMRQKIAACFAAFVTDIDGDGAALGEKSTTDDLLETLEPGLVSRLKPGQDVKFGTPPSGNDDGFTIRTLRKIAAGVGITYEDMTGDYGSFNFSSARMSRLRHWARVYGWRWNMLVPQMCDGSWAWAMEAAMIAGSIRQAPRAQWTAPPMPMIEPDKEGLALMRMVRSGAKTPSEMIRELGGDPDEHWAEYSADMKKLDALEIVIDSDARKVSQAGLTQERVVEEGAAAALPTPPPPDG